MQKSGCFYLKYFAYDRTSVSDSLKVSNEAQWLKIKKFVENKFNSVPTRFSDKGYSGGTVNRPGLQKLLREVKRNYEPRFLIVWRYDRLFRDATNAIEFINLCDKHCITIVSLSEPIPESTSFATKKMFVQLLFINANLQRDVIIENISNGLRYKRSQGKYISSVVPFGYYMKNGQIYQDPEESTVVKRMFQLYLTEKFGYRALAKQLSDEGLTFRGAIFKEHNIWSILNNTLYKGIVKGGSFGPYQGDFQPIIEDTTFDRVQKIRKSRQTIKRNTREYLLREKIMCPYCRRKLGSKIVRNKKAGKEYYYYCCSNRACQGISIRAEEIEQTVAKLLEKFLESKKMYKKLVAALDKEINVRRLKQKSKLSQLSKQRLAVMSQFENGDITLEVMKNRLAEVKNTEEITQQDKLVDKYESRLTYILQLREKPIREIMFERIDVIELDGEKKITKLLLKSLKENLALGEKLNGE